MEARRVAESFIADKVTFVPGRLQDSLRDYDGGSIAFLHLDVDFYASYKTALERLYEHVVPGGIVAFDEYRQSMWPGATSAIDEFFAARPESLVKSPITDLYYVVRGRAADAVASPPCRAGTAGANRAGPE